MKGVQKMQQYIMALDAGTTSSRCIIFDHGGHIKASAQQEFRQYYPHPGWVEHNADEIWETQLAVIRQAMEKSRLSAPQISAIDITNQRETTIVWDKTTGKPVCPAIVWQCRRPLNTVMSCASGALLISPEKRPAGCGTRIFRQPS